MTKIKAGIIGTGFIGPAHVEALRRLGFVEVAAVAERGDDHFVVASRGRVRRQTTWVPLEKVQSVRWVQGPLQRQLDLATVHLDVAGKRVSAKIEDRGNAEALAILDQMPDLARAARARAA